MAKRKTLEVGAKRQTVSFVNASVAMEVAKAAAADRLEIDEPVWCGFAARIAECPPAAAEALLPKRASDETAIYVSGIHEGRLVCGVWKESSLPNLDHVKARHVYCVAKAAFPKSITSTLHLARSSDDLRPHPGSIKCSAIQCRKDSRKAAYTISNNAPSTVVNGVKKQQKPPKEERPDDSPPSETTLKKNNVVSNNASKPTKQKTNNIANMFAKQSDKPKPVKTETKVTPSDPPEKEKEKSPPVKEEKPSLVTTEKPALKQTNGSVSKKHKSTSKSKSSAGKKRKRIAVAESDSEDSEKDDIFESASPEKHQTLANFEEEEIPSTPVVVAKAPEKINSRKRKKDKTYMDEDGYLHTVRGVLCSDDEAEDDQKENVKDNVADCDEIPDTPKPKDKSDGKNPKLPITIKDKKPVNNQVKQSNIMNFFKRK